ncbi:MAG: hypothetical protein HKN70_07405 [Gammaproteobacteria bacterium]|nr:hypothetical protein [Gammaproteobacteria bacterium]
MQCDLPIVGMGAVASVGRNAQDMCASIRAGISRPQPLDYYFSLDPDTKDLVPVSGHAVTALTEGFLLFGAWQRLARAAMDDLYRRANLPPANEKHFWDNTALICVLPVLNEDRFQSEVSNAPSAVKELFFGPLASYCGITVDHPGNIISYNGHAGYCEAVQRSNTLISSGNADRVLILGVDSYLDSFCLEWLDTNFRLKSGESPTGLAPGEAAACVLLEARASAENRRALIAGSITSVSLEQDCGFDAPNQEESGRGLAAVMNQTFGATENRYIELLTDQNGETWRAIQLSNARLRLSALRQVEVNISMPFASTGEIGAAWGPLATIFAVHNFQRGITSGSMIVATASSESGMVGAWSIARTSRDQAA